MRQDFVSREDEVARYFAFLGAIDSGVHRVVAISDGNPAYNHMDLTEITKTLKANSFLLLYNLVESTVKNAIEAIFDDLQANRIVFDACRKELRRIMLLNLKKRDIDKLLPLVTNLANDLARVTFSKDELFSGNVDARLIRKTALKYGFLEPSKRSGNLLTVKDNRNDLSHGNKTFGEVGREYDFTRLESIRKEVTEYLEELIVNIEQYIKSQGYLNP
ncbi:MAG TPA: MAE_28990/MAE_18760 family HEPN-like nuclease [Pirellula sp.]|nr:MAE_28990/MAE_18760 family HEPN-like nuclease [Pirellula sp.]